MTWTRLSDNFADRLDLAEVSRSARLLHVEALVWCNRLGSDGRVASSSLRRMTDAEDPDALIAELVATGVWAEVDGAWQLDWSEQEPAAEVRERQAQRAQKQKRYRDRKARHDRDDHSACDPRYCRKAVTGNATGNEDGNDEGLVTPSRPDPSRPLGRGRGQGGQEAGLAAVCEHGQPHGMKITGAGDQAGRHCLECERAHPLDEREVR